MSAKTTKTREEKKQMGRREVHLITLYREESKRMIDGIKSAKALRLIYKWIHGFFSD